jgi:hypothetical protein
MVIENVPMNADESHEIDLRLSIANLLEEKVTHRTHLKTYCSSTVFQSIHSINEEVVSSCGKSDLGSNVPSGDDISIFGTANIKRQQKRTRISPCIEDRALKRPRRLSTPQSYEKPKIITNQDKSDSLSCISKHSVAKMSEGQGMMQVLQRNAGLCCHIEDRRRVREREREFDRLGRLLRRAAELDVSRCCNDVRTLLLARGHSEELGLRIPSPPTSQGRIQVHFPISLNLHDTHQINASSKKITLNFPFAILPLPLAKRFNSHELQSLKMMDIILQISDFLHTYETSIKHQMGGVPNIAELTGALVAVEKKSKKFLSAHNMLSSVAIALLDISLPSLFTFLGISRSGNHATAPLIDLNKMTWQALARLSILIIAFRELGFADSDTMPEVCGLGGWVTQPNSDSADCATLALIKARIFSVECQDTVFESKPNLLVRIPVPRRSTSRSRVVSAEKEVMSSDSQITGSTRFILLHSEGLPQFKNNTTSVTRWCSTVIEILSAQPETQKLKYIVEDSGDFGTSEVVVMPISLVDIKNEILRGKYSSSLADFVADMRRVFQNCHCYMQEGCDNMQAVTKLGAIFERLLRERNCSTTTETYFELCAGCRISSRSTCPQLVRCSRCDAHYHLSCLQIPLNSVLRDWFCPTCVSLVRGPGAGDGIVCNVFEAQGVSFNVENILLPSCNTLLSKPHLIVKRDDGKYFQMVSDKVVTGMGVDSVENAGWGLPASAVPYKLDPSYSQHAADKCKQNNEFGGFIRAIRALSSDTTLHQENWIDILASLVSCATSTLEMNMYLSNQLAEIRGDMLNEPAFIISDEHEDKSITNPLLDDVLIEIPAGNRRKQRELLLVAGVVQDAVSYVKMGSANNIEGASSQLEANAQRGIIQDLLSMGDLDLSTGSPVNPILPRGTCVWCGGDYDYLRSAFVPAQQALKMSRAFNKSSFLVLPKTSPTGLALTHEFCSDCLTGQRAGALSRKRQRTLMTYKEKVLFTGRGRTQPLGTDTRGRIYWYFTQHTNLIGVQFPYRNKLSDSVQLPRNHDEWMCYCTVPSIAQLVMYLIELCNEQLDMLIHGVMLAFPEACALIKPNSNFLDCSYNSLTWTQLEITAVKSSLLNSSTSNIFHQPHLKVNEDVLVRAGELVWSATVKEIRVCEPNDIAYCIRYNQWNPSFDDWLSFEHFLLFSMVTCKAQRSLFQDRALPDLTRPPGLEFDLFKLVASDFIGKPFRAQTSLPSAIFKPVGIDNRNCQICSALLTISAALPAGSVTPGCGQFILKSVYRIERASSAVELTELVLALEDSLNKTWLRPSWSTIRSCLPTRTYFLKYASLSQVSLLIWVLDRGIIYDQVQVNKIPSPSDNYNLPAGNDALP